MRPLRSTCSTGWSGARLGIMLVVSLAGAMAAQTAFAQTTYGTLSNFDVFNDTGQECHGFEIELDGLSSADVTYTFGGSYNRYGTPRVINYPGGVRIRYESPYDAVRGVFTQATPLAPSVITATDGHACWTGGSGNYLTSGCEHFGVGIKGNATATVYRWLIADPANPGQLMAPGSKVSIPAPVWNVVPPAAPGAAPVVQAVLPPEPPEVHAQYGDAVWVKVFKTESPEPAELDHLVSDDPAVPQEAAETEMEWTILQARPAGAGNDELVNEGAVAEGAKSVTRRYEFYQYTGAYDPENHEAMCADGSCDQPQPGELGNYIGAQMAAVNLVAPPPPLALALAAAVPAGEVGLSYSAPLVSGGTPPYVIHVLRGAFPPGSWPTSHGHARRDADRGQVECPGDAEATDQDGAS